MTGRWSWPWFALMCAVFMLGLAWASAHRSAYAFPAFVVVPLLVLLVIRLWWERRETKR